MGNFYRGAKYFRGNLKLMARGTNEGAESKNRTAKSDKMFKKFKVILIVS